MVVKGHTKHIKSQLIQDDTLPDSAFTILVHLVRLQQTLLLLSRKQKNKEIQYSLRDLFSFFGIQLSVAMYGP